MTKLIWNNLECGWECSECGALYSEDEVARMFNYDNQTIDMFRGGYCMDCGSCFDRAIKDKE